MIVNDKFVLRYLGVILESASLSAGKSLLGASLDTQ